MAFLFEQLGITAILTGTRLENLPSVRLLEKLGLYSIGNGEFRLSKDEWLAQMKAA
jgi:RimJ/RimL family protein N-acetyltransferase